MSRAVRLRWRIANLLDRLPGTCWTELVCWGLGYRRLPWAPQRAMCRSDAAHCGGCYCGKIRGGAR